MDGYVERRNRGKDSYWRLGAGHQPKGYHRQQRQDDQHPSHAAQNPNNAADARPSAKWRE
jgi:hypothetical protein